MLTDLRDREAGSILEADLCIIGAGAAGITLARTFIGSGVQVLLLESGGRDFHPKTQDFNVGASIGMPYYDLRDARLRFFGGTTAIWGGRCIPLDAMDFERRDWVPGSGWPFDRAYLDPWYRRAHDPLGIGAFEYDDQVWERLRLNSPPFDPARMRSDFWRFDMARDRFTLPHCQDLQQSANVRILLHANCTGLRANGAASAIERLEVATPEGKQATVRARFVVLACGGIENPRLLLASCDVEKSGIGNGADVVGRYFMEHPHGRGGRVVARDPYRLWRLFRRMRTDDGVPVGLVWRPGEQAQAERRTLNLCMTLKMQRDPKASLSLNKRLFHAGAKHVDPHRAGRFLDQSYRALRRVSADFLRPSVEWFRARTGLRKVYVTLRAEQSPNPDSRVQLTGERDALGLPRVALDWRLTALDKESVAGNLSVLDGELRRLGLGHVEPAEWLRDGRPEWPVDLTVSNHHIAGFHHMGTTRMGTDPRSSVVDPDCRVHGYGNLFVAGSSVFPTSGWANPTLTIMALSLRLGDHLRRVMDRG